MTGYDPNFPGDPTREEDEASASSLALAPWVELQAQPLRAAHMAARIAETEAQAQAKTSKWRRGACCPRCGSHRV